MPARERLDLRAGRATASRPGAWAAPGPEPVVRYRLWRSPPPGQFLPAASRARGRWLRHLPRSAVARPARGTSSDGASRAAVRCRTPASRLTCSGGAAQQTEHLTYPAGRNERRVIPGKKKWPPAHNGREATCVCPGPSGRRSRPALKNPDELRLPRLAVPDKDVTAGSYLRVDELVQGDRAVGYIGL